MEPKQGTLFLPRLPETSGLKVVEICDAGEAPNDEIFKGRWNGCFAIGVSPADAPDYDQWTQGSTVPFSMIQFAMKTTRRVSSSSFDGEACTFVEATDSALAVAHAVEEYEFGIRPSLWQRYLTGSREEDAQVIPIEGFSDSKDWTEACRSLVYPKGLEKRRKADVADIQELQELRRLLPIQKIDGKYNPVDAGTKKKNFESAEMQRLRDLAQGIWVPCPVGAMRM